MFRRLLALTAILVVAGSMSARAAERSVNDATPIATSAAREARAAAALDYWALSQTEKRPATLMALYGTYGAIQVMDIVSTRRAVSAGAREQNPLIGKGNVGQMIAIKAAAGASTIFFTERLWKKNKVGAILVMAALNGTSAAIVVRNQRNARR